MIIDKPLQSKILYLDPETEGKITAIYSTIAALRSANKSGAVTVSLNGAWGTGKSSYLNGLQRRYEEAGSRTLLFEAWRYAEEPDIFLALLEELYTVLGSDTTAKRNMRSLIKSLGVATLVGADVLLKSTLDTGIEDIEKRFKTVEDHIRVQTTRSRKDRERLDRVLKKLGDKEQPFVLLVDDLDRLVPDKAYALLEKLRFYFEGDDVVVIMAINDEVINRFVHKHHAIDNPTQMSEAFIDKIFHYSFELPYTILNPLHLRSIRACHEGYIEPLKRLFDRLTVRLPHRKWINILNRIETQLCSPANLKRKEGIDSIEIETVATLTLLQELYPEFNYLYRRHEEALLDSDSSELRQFKAEMIRQEADGLTLFTALIEAIVEPSVKERTL